MDDAQRITLLRIRAEALEHEREEHYKELRENCLHYGPLHVKFDGGRRPVYCGLCGQVVFRWNSRGFVEVDV